MIKFKMTSVVVALPLVFATANTALPQSSRDLSPNDLVEAAIVEIAAGLDGRKEELAEDRDALLEMINAILLPRFDRKYAAQLVLGKHWRTANAEQRERFIDALYNSLLSKYADGVLEFEHDRIDVFPFRGDASKQRTMVRSIVRLNDGSKVPVNYGLVMRESGWLMFDVTIEGISYIRNFRAEIDSEIRSSSLEQVITRLESDAGIVEGE